MNILHHKSWHVRTQKNIARVRKDEAKAAAEEKEIQRRISLAAQEARTQFLRDRANKRVIDKEEELPDSLPLAKVADIVQKDGHVNFFQEIEDGTKQEKVNAEHEEEKKNEQDDYEKKIGYLVYLGQNSLEHSKERPWYERIDRGKPSKLDKDKFKEVEQTDSTSAALNQKSNLTTEEIKMTKFKDFHDPLKDIRKYLTTPGVQKKMEKASEKMSSRKRKLEETISKSLPDVHSKSRTKRVKKEKKHKSKKRKECKDKKHKHRKSSRQKKDKKSKSSSSFNKSSPEEETESECTDSEEEAKQIKLKNMRAERLEREREERRRTEKVLAKLRGDILPEDKPRSPPPGTRQPVKQRYNSQFNPQIARQNFSSNE